METKKSSKADLENGRLQRFSLGLLVSVAIFFIALEYNIEPDDPLDDPDLLEQLSAEAELSPILNQPDMIALAPKVEPPPTTKLKIVEEEEKIQKAADEEPVETDHGEDLPNMEDEKPEEPEITDEDEQPIDFRVVEDLPQFPGGPTELMKWLTRNLKYPSAAQDLKQQGKVVAEFIVERDGSLTGIKIIKSLSPYCDNETLRVLRMMPRWTAGIQNDEPCRTKVCIPIVFKL